MGHFQKLSGKESCVSCTCILYNGLCFHRVQEDRLEQDSPELSSHSVDPYSKEIYNFLAVKNRFIILLSSYIAAYNHEKKSNHWKLISQGYIRNTQFKCLEWRLYLNEDEKRTRSSTVYFILSCDFTQSNDSNNCEIIQDFVLFRTTSVLCIVYYVIISHFFRNLACFKRFCHFCLIWSPVVLVLEPRTCHIPPLIWM